MYLKRASIATILVFFSLSSFADNEQPILFPDTNQFNEQFTQQFNEQLSQKLYTQFNISMEVLNKPELIEANAKYIKSLYDALIKQGFTKSEALQLVSATLSNQK